MRTLGFDTAHLRRLATFCAVFVPCRRRGPGSSPNKELCSLVLPAHRPVKWMVGTQGEAGGVLFSTFGMAAIVRCTITATTVAPTSIRLSFIRVHHGGKPNRPQP